MITLETTQIRGGIPYDSSKRSLDLPEAVGWIAFQLSLNGKMNFIRSTDTQVVVEISGCGIKDELVYYGSKEDVAYLWKTAGAIKRQTELGSAEGEVAMRAVMETLSFDPVDSAFSMDYREFMRAITLCYEEKEPLSAIL